ncbi:MAG TPA: ATP-binding protein [Longimicrobiales bacterium]|nr:ATP-binding protein [Longimicrobiales bacterium]
MTILPRAIAPRIVQALADTPVVVLNGARQVGKTTLVRSLPYRGTSAFVTLDDVASRESAELDPRAFLIRPVDTLVIDEVQLVPALFRAIKAEVDRDRRPGRFLLTGSSRLLTAPDMADALVGRVETLELWPFSQGEIGGRADRFVDRIFDAPRDLLRNGEMDRRAIIERVVAGGFPEALRRAPARRRDWLDGYVTTVTQSVIRDLAAIERLAELPRLVRLCAARTATELNVSALASDFGVPIRTTDGYLALLANAFLVHFLPAWSTNLSSKVVRRPKLVMADSGLAAHLIGAERSTFDAPDGRLGPLLEIFVVNEIRKQTTWSEHRPSLWHFRDRGGAEVDLILEHPDGRIVALEVKATSTPRTSDLSGLRFLADRLGERFHFGVLLTAASEATPFGPRMAALPVSAIWS